MTTYNKPVLTTAQHIAQWKKRGLAVPDMARAEHYLNVVSYYRLSAYTFPFQKGNPDHQFNQGACFDDILDLYVFDRELRLLILDAIERIEVAFRAGMTNVMAQHHGTHAYIDKAIFDTRYNHNWLINQLKQKCAEQNSEVFIAHYRNKYKNPELPSIWMAMAILTFREVSVLFTNLRLKEDKQAIAQYWGMPDTVLKSWFRALSDLRNVCAHHARTWNREIGSRPRLPKKPPARWPDLTKALADPKIDMKRRLYFQLIVIESLLNIVNPESEWHKRFYGLMQKHPTVSKAHMGIPDDWDEDPFWRLA